MTKAELLNIEVEKQREVIAVYTIWKQEYLDKINAIDRKLDEIERSIEIIEQVNKKEEK